MATNTIPMEIDDKELFANAVSEQATEEAPPETPEEPKPEPETQEGRQRDEKGRFIAKEQEKQADAAPTERPPAETGDDVANVPSWRLREVREAREAAERRAEEASRELYAMRLQFQQLQQQIASAQQPRQEPVDFFSDPDAAFRQNLAPIEERFARLEGQMKVNASRAMAIAEYGRDEVYAMETAIDKAMRENHPDLEALRLQVRQSDDPAGVAMRWYRGQRVLSETGGDLNAFREKVLAEALKDQKFLAKAIETVKGSPTTPSKIDIPPSLSRAPGSGSANSASLDVDASDSELFKYAMGR